MIIENYNNIIYIEYMLKVNINRLVDQEKYLIKDIPNNYIIIWNIDKLYIKLKYDQLDLSKIKCNKLIYCYQDGESIKNHILPESLNILNTGDNDITELPVLPNSLKNYIVIEINYLNYQYCLIH